MTTVKTDIRVDDVDALAEACEALGYELVRVAPDYAWRGALREPAPVQVPPHYCGDMLIDIE